jgi:hypothetical protein
MAKFDLEKYRIKDTPTESGKFDLEKYRIKPEPAEESKTRDAELGDFIPNSDTLTAIASGFNDGSTFGYGANVAAAMTDPLNYVKTRDALQKQNDDFDRTNVLARATGKTIGGLASAAALPFSKMAQGANYLGRLAGITADSYAAGAIQNPGNVQGQITPLQFNQRLDNASESAKYGLMLGGGIDGALSVKRQMPAIKNKIGNSLKSKAEALAENATGATGAQSSKFEEGAGRQLLDRGLVKFGDNAENIAKRVGDAQDDAGKAISDALEKLDQQGVTASVDNVVKELETKVFDLNKSSGNEKLIGQIQKEIDNLYGRAQSNTPVSLGEQSKRNFQGRTNYKNPDLIDQQSSAYVADAFKNEVESAALAGNNQLGTLFKEGKETYKLLEPVREAAEKRAATLNQSPLAGLLDVTGAIAGGAAAGVPGAVVGSAGRRIFAPRLSSSAAISFDAVSKKLLSNPKFKQLSASNPAQFNAMVLNTVQRAVDANTEKGPDKWASVGSSKLMESGIDQETIDKLKQSKKGRDLLFKASDLPSNSKAMQNLIRQIQENGEM